SFEIDYLNAHYLNQTGISDYYALFMARALTLLKRDAFLGYIIPSAWLGGPAYKKFRFFCLNHTVSRIISLPFDVFEDAYVDTLVIIMESGKPNIEHRSLTYVFPKKSKIGITELQSAPVQQVTQAKWLDTEDHKIILDRSSLDLLVNLRKRTKTTLADFIEIKRGVLFDKSLLTDEKKTAQSYPYFEGSVYRYKLEYSAPHWIEFNDQLTERPKEFKWFEGNRILLRRL